MDDDPSRRRVAVADDLVARYGFAAVGDLELRFVVRQVLCRGDIARLRGLVALLLFLRDEEGPEFQYLALGIDLQHLFQIVERDDPRSDLAVELLLVVALVDRHDLA